MGNFRFRLERVLLVRETQERTERQKLEQLQAAKNALHQELQQWTESLERAQAELRSAPQVSAPALVQLNAYRESVTLQQQRLQQRLREEGERVDAQSQALMEARRQVKLLEKLREKQRGEWQAQSDREAEAFGSDFAAAQWIRLNSR